VKIDKMVKTILAIVRALKPLNSKVAQQFGALFLGEGTIR